MASMDGDSMAMSVSAAPPRDRALLVQPAAHSGGPAPAVVATFEELIGLEGVAEGLYGEVYIATWRGQDVAVKVQKTNVKQLRMEKVAAVGGKIAMNTVNEDVAYSFDLEKAVLSNIRPHPNIVRLLAYGAHDNRSFLVEEQLESTLTKRITSTPLPFDEAQVFVLLPSIRLKITLPIRPPCHRRAKFFFSFFFLFFSRFFSYRCLQSSADASPHTLHTNTTTTHA